MSFARTTVHARSAACAHAANADLFEGSPWAIERAVPLQHRRHPELYHRDVGDMVSAVQDLWLRMACHPGLRMHITRDTVLACDLVLVRMLSTNDLPARRLLGAARDVNLYRWVPTGEEERSPRGLCSLVQALWWRDSKLVIELVPPRRLQRWGGNVAWEVQALLERIRRISTELHVTSGARGRVSDTVLSKGQGQASACDCGSSAGTGTLGAASMQVASTSQDSSTSAQSTPWQDQMRALKRDMDAWGI